MFIARSNILFLFPSDEITIAVGINVRVNEKLYLESLQVSATYKISNNNQRRRFDYELFDPTMVAQNISSKFRSSAC